MIELGISSACLYPMETEKALSEIGKNGIKTAEIFFNAECELKKEFIRELVAIKEEYGMNIVSVHPTMSLAESFMLFSAYERRKIEGLESYKRYGEIAAELGARFVIMHGGKPNGVLDDREYFERFIEISDAVKLNGANLLQENVAKYRAGELNFLKAMADYLGEKAQFCLDIKQCIRNGYSPIDMLECVGKNIKHLHISDHNENADCLIPSKGKFNFVEFFKKCDEMGYEGAAIAEVYRWSYGDMTELFSVYDKFLSQQINEL